MGSNVMSLGANRPKVIRRPRTHREPGPVSIKWRCPKCGGGHPVKDCPHPDAA